MEQIEGPYEAILAKAVAVGLLLATVVIVFAAGAGTRGGGGGVVISLRQEEEFWQLVATKLRRDSSLCGHCRSRPILTAHLFSAMVERSIALA